MSTKKIAAIVQSLKNAVEAYLSGKCRLDSLCEKFKIRSRKQLRDWIKVYT